MSFSRRGRRRCGPRSSRSWAGRRSGFGAARKVTLLRDADRRATTLAAICHEADASKAQDQHGPGGWLRNGRRDSDDAKQVRPVRSGEYGCVEIDVLNSQGEHATAKRELNRSVGEVNQQMTAEKTDIPVQRSREDFRIGVCTCGLGEIHLQSKCAVVQVVIEVVCDLKMSEG